MKTELTLNFEVISPLFLGGQSQQAELRPPALKGLLRFWYRAIDPKFSQPGKSTHITRESLFFGGTENGAGQCPFLLHIDTSTPPPVVAWKEFRAARFNQGQGRE